jgi:DNA-directed RNA polymerase specialized sigma subunit
MEEFRSYLKDIEEFPDFREDPARVSVLVEKMRRGDEAARLSLIESTLKYIAALANGHCKKWTAWQHRLDLVQEANTEVSERIAGYDPALASFKDFISYRSYVAFVRFWRRSKTVNSTEYGAKIASNLKKVQLELTSSLGRKPSLEELSERVGMDEADVDAILTSPVVDIVSIGEQGEDDHDGKVVRLDSLVSQDFNPFRLIEALELRELLVECLGATDADLLLAYVESKTDGFRYLYLQIHGREITAAAARKAKERLLKRLMNCPRVKERLSERGETP